MGLSPREASCSRVGGDSVEPPEPSADDLLSGFLQQPDWPVGLSQQFSGGGRVVTAIPFYVWSSDTPNHDWVTTRSLMEGQTRCAINVPNAHEAIHRVFVEISGPLLCASPESRAFRVALMEHVCRRTHWFAKPSCERLNRCKRPPAGTGCLIQGVALAIGSLMRTTFAFRLQC